MKHLYKNKENKVICGILGGVGEYFQVDPTLLRLGYVLACLFTGVAPLVVVYLVACLIVPEATGRKKK